MKYREVGTIFKHKGYNIEVIEQEDGVGSCDVCAFFHMGECDALACSSKHRKDKKNVAFIGTDQPCNELVKVSELARALNVCTQNIYKKIKRGMKTKKNKRGELVTSEAFLEEYKKNNPVGRPKK